MEKNNYPSWLVSVEQAKRLKELGFNEPCIFSYSEGIGITACIRTGSGDEPNFTDFIIGGNSKGSPLTDLPTYEQVFEWFREKGLVAVIVTNEILNEGDPLYFSSVDDLDGDYYTLDNYYTYEEAREAVLDKLIELYENSI
jgi:hypothetical protein